MTTRQNLRGLFRGLEALYRSPTGIDPGEHVVATALGVRREAILMREMGDTLEVALLLDPELLARFEQHAPDAALHDVSASLPVIEGLSHLLYLAESARRERPVSALELETQAEVDKLAVHVLHRWPPQRHEFCDLVDHLYHRFTLLPDVQGSLARRYEHANQIALGFSRRVWPHVERRSLPGLRGVLREFWSGSMAQKRALAS